MLQPGRAGSNFHSAMKLTGCPWASHSLLFILPQRVVGKVKTEEDQCMSLWAPSKEDRIKMCQIKSEREQRPISTIRLLLRSICSSGYEETWERLAARKGLKTEMQLALALLVLQTSPRRFCRIPRKSSSFSSLKISPFRRHHIVKRAKEFLCRTWSLGVTYSRPKAPQKTLSLCRH